MVLTDMLTSTFTYKKIAFLFLAILAIAVLAVSMHQHVAQAATCGGTEVSTLPACPDNGKKLEDNAVWSILLLVINILSAGVGLVAIGGLVYASILYSSAQNNSGQVTKAKETIFNVILGMVMFALMWSFLQFLIPGGIFS
ncbi:MAG TPA: hypothetical protein VGE34_04130 [Candidatus Saccharimonadales bacterium]